MGPTIMVVDDSMMVRQQVGRALTAAGFVVIDAVDGRDALDKLATKPEVMLLVCDVNMPRMNGLELLASLRRDPALADLPVVMLTTEGDADMMQRAKALGAKGWIVKPFAPEMLVATARKLTAKGV